MDRDGAPAAPREQVHQPREYIVVSREEVVAQTEEDRLVPRDIELERYQIPQVGLTASIGAWRKCNFPPVYEYRLTNIHEVS